MMDRQRLAKYLPVGVFIALSVASVALVVKAQTGPEPRPVPPPVSHTDPLVRGESDKLFAPLDAQAEKAAEIPALIDWGKEFKGAGSAPPPPPVKPTGLLTRIARNLSRARTLIEESAQRAEQERKERETGIARLAGYNLTLPPIGTGPVWPSSIPPLDPGKSVFDTRPLQLTMDLDPADFADADAFARHARALASQGFIVNVKRAVGRLLGVPSAVEAGNAGVRATPMPGFMNPLPPPPTDTRIVEPPRYGDFPATPASGRTAPGAATPDEPAPATGHSASAPSASSAPRAAVPAEAPKTYSRQSDPLDEAGAKRFLAKLKGLGYAGTIRADKDPLLHWYRVHYTLTARPSDLRAAEQRIHRETGVASTGD